MVRADGDGRRASPGRRHAIVPHTADAGLVVVGPSLAALFEEAAQAVADLTADIDPGTPATAREDVRLEARDLAGLAYDWLNELVALGDVHRGALVDATVDRVDRPAGSGSDRPWRLVGSVGLASYATTGVRPRRQVKSATYHRLEVARRGRTWTMRAYLDI